MEVLPVDLGVPQGAEDPPADEGLRGHLEQTRNRALRMGRVEWSICAFFAIVTLIIVLVTLSLGFKGHQKSA